MSDLISRKKTIRAIDSLGEDYISYYKLLMLIGRLPSAEPERKHGEWNNYKDEHGCSVCQSVVIQGNWDDDIRYDYCPYCGAEMTRGNHE